MSALEEQTIDADSILIHNSNAQMNNVTINALGILDGSAKEGLSASYIRTGFGDFSANNFMLKGVYKLNENVVMGVMGGYETYNLPADLKAITTDMTGYFAGAYTAMNFDSIEIAASGKTSFVNSKLNKKAKAGKDEVKTNIISAQAQAGYRLDNLVSGVNFIPGVMVRYNHITPEGGLSTALLQAGPVVGVRYIMDDNFSFRFNAAALYDVSNENYTFVKKDVHTKESFMDKVSFDGVVALEYSASENLSVSANAGVNLRPKAKQPTSFNVAATVTYDIL